MALTDFTSVEGSAHRRLLINDWLRKEQDKAVPSEETIKVLKRVMKILHAEDHELEKMGLSR